MVDRIRARFVERVRQPRLRIPRKGRIRIALLLVAAIFAFLAIGSALRHAPSPADRKKAASERPEAPRLGRNATSAEVAAVFARVLPRLDRAEDTLELRSGRAVASYSIDTGMQRFVYGLLKQYRPRYAAGAVIDPHTGRVLALVSWRDDTLPDLGNSLYCRSLFPAASIFKTVTAAAAIEKAAFSDSTLVPVAGRNHTLYRFQLKKEVEAWNEIMFEDAYANSVNAVFARIGMHFLGRRALQEYAARFGFGQAIPFELPLDKSMAVVPEDTSYAMAEFASGFNRSTSLSALHGALIAAAIAEGGEMPVPCLIDSLVRADGVCLYRSGRLCWKRAVAKKTAAELRRMMNRVVTRGTARKAFRFFRTSVWSSGLEYGGKTGSIEADTLGKVDWFVGFAVDPANPSRRLAAGIVTTHGEYWTVHSAYIASEIFRKFLHPSRFEKAGSDTTLVRAAQSAAPLRGSGE